MAYLAWAWCISSRPDRSPVCEQARQTRMLADAYRLESPDRARLPAAIGQRLLRNEAFWCDVLNDPHAPRERRDRATGTIDWTRQEFRHIGLNQGAFVAALSQ